MLGRYRSPWIRFLGLSLAWVMLVAIGHPALASERVALRAATPAQSATLAELRRAQVIYLGENHDSSIDHAAELDIIQGLVSQNPRIAIAVEMVQRPFQPILDAYLAGTLDEAALVAQTEYEQRWGYPWEYYAPIFRFAQARQIPLLALNTPTEVTQKVARSGLGSLSEEDQRFIPPLSEIHTDNAAYRSSVEEIFNEVHGEMSQSLNFENFFAAQVLWDETMADAIAQFLGQHPDTQVVVLAGQGHVVFGYGIPDRVARRLGETLSQQVVLLNPDSTLLSKANPSIADHFWVSSPPVNGSP